MTTGLRRAALAVLLVLVGCDEQPGRGGGGFIPLLGDGEPSQRSNLDGGPFATPDTGAATPTPDSAPSPTPPSPPPPSPSSCDPAFRGPFCTETQCDGAGNCEVTGKHPRVIGYQVPNIPFPTMPEARKIMQDALNVIRARTCLEPMVLDSCLNQIAEKALAANSGHGYFIQNCLMKSGTNYGKNCECNWTQEAISATSGSNSTWVDGLINGLCRQMTEPYGTGHRSNLECKHWKRLGAGIDLKSSGGTWYLEFGCDLSLNSCPKRND